MAIAKDLNLIGRLIDDGLIPKGTARFMVDVSIDEVVTIHYSKHAAYASKGLIDELIVQLEANKDEIKTVNAG